jgi:ADP-heptose:LPS heptosyltransferase
MAARNILVIKLGALGDLFLAMDAFQAIRAHHAGDRVTLLTRPAFAKFAADLPWFDEVMTDLTPRGLRLDQWLAMRRRLRSGGFARVYDLQCNGRTGIYHRLLGPGRRPEWAGIASGCSHPWPDYRRAALSVPERQLRMIEAAGVPRLERPVDLSWLDAPLAGLPPLPERFVLLVPGCAPHRLEKRWPAARYAELARLLVEHRGLASVVIGTAADQASVDELCAAAPAVVNLCGKTSLKQLGALARRALAVVGNDTGPVHITAAVGAPTLVVMSGHSDPVRMRPRGPAVEVLQEQNLADLSAERVLAALRPRAD